MKTFDEKIKEAADEYANPEIWASQHKSFIKGVAWLRANLREVPEVRALVEALKIIKDEKLNYECGSCSEERWMALAHFLKETAEYALKQFNTDKGDGG